MLCSVDRATRQRARLQSGMSGHTLRLSSLHAGSLTGVEPTTLVAETSVKAPERLEVIGLEFSCVLAQAPGHIPVTKNAN